MELYPHNKEAYDKVMAHYNSGAQRACVIHATGTGKAHIGGAVASNFDRVLIVAPNHYVLNQASFTAKQAQLMTYSYISIQEDIPRGYDLIWFDEFHRMGAPIWKNGVDRLIEANPTAKILGTTATPERALEQRNMATEYFEGDIVSKLTLTDAWCNNILQTPTYVIGIVEFDNIKRDYITRINTSKRLEEKIKQQAIAKVNNVARNWQLAGGMTAIFRKYIDKNVRRMVVFAPTVSQVKHIKQSVHNWLIGAGLEHYKTYHVHYNSRNNNQQFAEFAKDDFCGIKVMIAVDMLNEGVHIPDVDCVLLLRSTISKNVYMQQIGRCFSINNKHKPIVLDMADNLYSANEYNEIYKAKERFCERCSNRAIEEHEEDAFTITDEIKEIRELMSDIDGITGIGHTKEECIESAQIYNTRHEWEKGCPLLYHYAVRHKWLDECCAHMDIRRRTKTKEECKADALLYKSRRDWQIRSKAIYAWAMRRGWLDECCAHMPPLRHVWTKKQCMLSAKQYSRRVDWKRGSGSTYVWAKNHGILDECCAHMKRRTNNKQI